MVDRKAGTCGFTCRLLVHSWTLVTSATGADEQQMSLLPASSNELASFLCRETPTKRDVASVSCALLGSFSAYRHQTVLRCYVTLSWSQFQIS